MHEFMGELLGILFARPSLLTDMLGSIDGNQLDPVLARQFHFILLGHCLPSLGSLLAFFGKGCVIGRGSFATADASGALGAGTSKLSSLCLSCFRKVLAIGSQHHLHSPQIQKLVRRQIGQWNTIAATVDRVCVTVPVLAVQLRLASSERDPLEVGKRDDVKAAQRLEECFLQRVGRTVITGPAAVMQDGVRQLVAGIDE